MSRIIVKPIPRKKFNVKAGGKHLKLTLSKRNYNASMPNHYPNTRVGLLENRVKTLEDNPPPTIDIDGQVTEASTNPVSSAGIWAALSALWNSVTELINGIFIPTKTSDLENDSGFITADDEVLTNIQGHLAELTSETNPITIGSLTFEITGEEQATITTIATGGVGVLTYKLYDGVTLITSNGTGIFVVTQEKTFTVKVSDEVESVEASEDIAIAFAVEFIFSRNVNNGTTLITVESPDDSGLQDILDAFEAAVVDDTTGLVNYYLDRTNPNLKADGVTPSILTGADGSVFIIKPAFWVKVWQEGDVVYHSISLNQKVGFRLSPKYAFAKYRAHRPTTGTHANKLVSWSGVTSTTNRNLTEYRADARLNRDNRWNVTPYVMYNDLIMLYQAVVQNLDSQTALGYVSNAVSADWSAYNAYNPVWACGYMNDKSTFFTGSKAISIPNFVGGANPLNTQVVSFLGIEDFFGHLWEFLDGIMMNYTAAGVGKAYKCTDYTKFTDGTGTEPADGYVEIGDVTTAGYIKEMHLGENVPKVTGSPATSSAYYSDYHYTSSAAGWRAALSGGSLIYGALSGCFYSTFSYAASYRAAAVGARLGLYLD